MSDGDFDDVIDELGGFGKYQKRLLYILLCPLFLIMPFPLLHQMFVLHVPAHTCVHPEQITAEALGINETVWQVIHERKCWILAKTKIIFKGIFLPMGYQGPSQCSYYNFTSENVNILYDLWQFMNIKLTHLLAGLHQEELDIAVWWRRGHSGIARLGFWGEMHKVGLWHFRVYRHGRYRQWLGLWQGKLLSRGVRCQFLRVENVFLQANYVPDLFTLAVVGLILGTFIFSAIADFFGRKLSFYVGSATVIVFTLCMVPTDFNFHLFAFFKVHIHNLIWCWSMLLLSSRWLQHLACCPCSSLRWTFCARSPTLARGASSSAWPVWAGHWARYSCL